VSTAGDGHRSTGAVGLWALTLGAFAWALGHGGGQLVPLAYQMTALSYPPLLGLLLLAAFAPRAWLRRPALGALGAIGLVVALLPLTTGPASSLAFPWLFPLGTVTFLALTILPKRAN
jgi:peptidoglycan/LPS O-acetylase OafA/YrhL